LDERISELEGFKKEVVRDKFKVLSWYLLGGTEEMHEHGIACLQAEIRTRDFPNKSLEC
jgi:hypothetical protein